MQLKPIILLACIYSLSACQPEIAAEELSLGEIDPTTYVAIGTEGPAGYADDALSSTGQVNSFAQILADQFSQITTINFSSPILLGTAGINLDGASKLILGYKTDCKNETSLSPVRLAPQGDISELSTNIFGAIGPFNNMGIPNTRILDMNLSGYGNSANGAGNYNPYYSRIASDEANSSILQDAIGQNPTFYSVQLGDHDLLSYALSGGTSTIPPPANGAAGVGFDGSLNEVVQSLNGIGAKGIIGNIPDITQFPYFTTIPYNGLTLNAEDVVTLNSVFNPLGLTFQEGDNPFTVEDASEPFGVRKLEAGELILLSIPLDSVKCNGMGSIVPIPDKYVLSHNEITILKSKLTEYNSIILSTSQSNNIAHVDVNSFYNSLNSGIVYNGVSMDANFVTGGFFSLDGRNLNPIGQALLANKYIESINDKYNSRIPFADVTKFSGVIFP